MRIPPRLTGQPVYRFDGFVFDLRRGALFDRHGIEVPLRPKAFATLRFLVENAGRLIDREEILAAVWPGVFVTEDSVTLCVRELRRALDDNDRTLLRTIQRRGYVFTGEVSRLDFGEPRSAASPRTDTPAGKVVQVRPAALRPTLVVLPFVNMSGDPEQDFLADGLTEDLTIALSRPRWFSVIARNSAFTYKGRAVDVRDVGRSLGADYVVEGSVRRFEGQMRIGVQLCEAENGRHIWADRFDGALTGFFEFQDSVVHAVVGALEPTLRWAEYELIRSKPTESLGAYELYLRALPRLFAQHESNDEALRLLRRAIALDNGFTSAKGAFARLVTIRAAQGWADARDVAEALRHARDVAEGGAQDPGALAEAGYALTYLGRDYEAGLGSVERAVLLAPDSPTVLFQCGWVRQYTDAWRGAVDQVERAMQLSPADPSMWHFQLALSSAYMVGEQYEQAVEYARATIRRRPFVLVPYRLLIGCLGQLGRREEAAAAIRALLARAPGETIGSIADASALRGAVRNLYLKGLRKAGMPE